MWCNGRLRASSAPHGGPDGHPVFFRRVSAVQAANRGGVCRGRGLWGFPDSQLGEGMVCFHWRHSPQVRSVYGRWFYVIVKWVRQREMCVCVCVYVLWFTAGDCRTQMSQSPGEGDVGDETSWAMTQQTSIRLPECKNKERRKIHEERTEKCKELIGKRKNGKKEGRKAEILKEKKWMK